MNDKTIPSGLGFIETIKAVMTPPLMNGQIVSDVASKGPEGFTARMALEKSAVRVSRLATAMLDDELGAVKVAVYVGSAERKGILPYSEVVSLDNATTELVEYLRDVVGEYRVPRPVIQAWLLLMSGAVA